MTPSKPHGHFPSELSFAENWARVNRMFLVARNITLFYDEAVSRPLQTLQQVHRRFGISLKPIFIPVFERVGWWGAEHRQPIVSREDMEYLEEIRSRL